ncbi:MAG: hypothetical protein RSA29_18595 [Clostridium sp.]|uniref:hypothetical protein n=1 Tax=Clostridium sp. TaxID=1506 RepID=UPI00302A593A
MNKTKENKKKFGIPPVVIPQDDSIKKIPISPKEIDIARQRAQEKLQFSFKFLNNDHEAFNLGSLEKRDKTICGEWFVSLLLSLKDVCDINRNQLMAQRQHYDTHGFEWDKLDYKFDFNDNFLDQVECMQFRVSSSKGRVHGFIIGNTFYIVWLDPHHNLYPDERFGGRKFFQGGPSCYEKLQESLLDLHKENAELKKQNGELMNMIDELTSPGTELNIM